MAGISSKGAGKLKNEKNKFQGQEFTDDLGLDMYEFKWRMHDPQTGRFWQIDPLSDKYVYNSTYAFSENKVTGHVELEGLEAFEAKDGGVISGPYRNQNEAQKALDAGKVKSQPHELPEVVVISKPKTHDTKLTATFTFGAQAQVEIEGVGLGAGIAVDLLGVRDNKSVAFATTAGEKGAKVRKFVEGATPAISFSQELEETRVDSKTVATIEKLTVNLFSVTSINFETDKNTNKTSSWISLSFSIKASAILGFDFGLEIPIKELGTTNQKSKN